MQVSPTQAAPTNYHNIAPAITRKSHRAQGNKFQRPVSILFVSDDAQVCFSTLTTCAMPQSSLQRQAIVIFGAMCAEWALLAYVTSRLFEATVLGAITSALFSWSFATSKADDSDMVRKITARTSLGWILLIAATFALAPALWRAHLFRGLGGSSTASHSSEESSGRKRDRPKPDTEGNSVSAASEAYSGIVLWPKKQAVTKLVAPAPMSWDQEWASTQRSTPLIIPFDGVYWFFRTPDTQPPAKARQATGSPDMFEIHSTDLRALSMEAHQNLGDLVDLSCCSRIEVSIVNGDHYPHSVSLELVLIDNSSAPKPSQSLGWQTVNSTRPWRMDDERPAPTETLKFAIPRISSLKRFDEVAIVFRLDGYRARTGAKIGIDHFTLVPRGL